MKPRILSVFILIVVVMAFALALAVAAQEPSGLSGFLATPPPTIPLVPTHIPYSPFERLETLPAYPYNNTRPPRSQSQASLTKPAGIDLDVTYISRTPLYSRYDVWYTDDGKPYLRPGTENYQRWPVPGEVVTFTVHITNKGTIASGSFTFRWHIDGSEVHSGTHGSLAPGEEGIETYQWAWAHTMDGERLMGNHTVRFTVDPANAIPETYESNNSLEDRTDALSLVLAVTPELYAALEIPVDPKWPFSAEDWLQKQIAAMNTAFSRSVYPSTPSGIVERVRLDKIIVSSSDLPPDLAEDGGFHMRGDDRLYPGYYDPTTDVSGALIHELTHQLGVIDIYGLDVPLEIPQVLDRNGRPAQMELSVVSLLPGLMGDPGIRPPVYDEHTALALNANQGYRRGYYGEYLYDVPAQTTLRVRNNQGNPAVGVTVKLYQRASSPNMRGSRHGVVDDIPEISVVTGVTGTALLPNRPVGDPLSTHTGHTLTDNPLGVIDVVGQNDEFLVEVSKGTHQEFLWLDVTRFNLAAWRGETTIDIASHVPPDDAPDPPAALAGTLAYGQVALQWQPSPSAGISGYNVYRTSGPACTYTRIVTGTTVLNYQHPYDYSARAASYAVAAVDGSGRESGFSDLFWALRIWNPTSITVDEGDQRIVLDPQNGYALLLQSPDGVYLDTLGSFDLHLENSQYIARDPAGRLIISHPGDWYSPRHSVRVTDGDANLLFEFGQEGSGPGQFKTPTGVAAWGDPCTFGGPYAVDAHTMLLLHFDGSNAGAQGEPGMASGTSFASGRHDQGVLVDDADTLTYATADSLEREQGAIEFWISPQWDGDDGQSYTLFEVGNGWFNRLRIMKDGANNLRFMLWDSNTETGVAYNVAYWQAGEWHHVAATWAGTDIALYVDGEQQASSDDASPPDVLANTMHVGSSLWNDQQADAVMDELRISDIPRIGNSDTCTHRILVADSGNHRVQAFDVGGNFISAYGSPGSGPGQFNDPQGLAVDDSGVIIVADSGNNRLQVLSFDGTTFGFLRTIGAELNGPTGIAAYGTNRIIVTDTGNNKVKVLDAQGNLLSEYGAPNDGYTGAFNRPRGVTADRSARIIVADTDNRRVVTVLDALPVWLPTSVAIAGPTTGVVQFEYTFTATVSPMTATLPITYVWQATEQVPTTHAGNVTDTISFTWSTTGTHAITVTATNAGGRVADTHIVTINSTPRVYLPVVLHNNP